MKKASIAAVLLVVVLLCVLVYGVVTTRLAVTPVSAQVILAADQPAEFERLQHAVDNQSLLGTVYQQQAVGDIREYSLILYTVEVKNNGLLPAQMAEVVVAPTGQDVLCYMEGALQGNVPNISIGAGQSVRMRCMLLTKTQERTHAVRDLLVSYYIWGNPFIIKTTYR